MKQWHDLIRYTLKNGVFRQDRTGTGTTSVFGYQMRFDLQEGFPLFTTKHVSHRMVLSELLWFLRGDTNIKSLHETKCHIWDDWADENGDLGPIYGKQWVAWKAEDTTINQIEKLIHQLRNNPDSRRMVVSAWNVADLDKMALHPCHMAFQCYVADNELSMCVTQRSADVGLGVPYNIASYAFLTHMLAAQADLDVGELVWNGGDCHIYQNHEKPLTHLLDREPHPLPILTLAKKPSIFDYEMSDFTLTDYKSHPAVQLPRAV